MKEKKNSEDEWERPKGAEKSWSVLIKEECEEKRK